LSPQQPGFATAEGGSNNHCFSLSGLVKAEDRFGPWLLLRWPPPHHGPMESERDGEQWRLRCYVTAGERGSVHPTITCSTDPVAEQHVRTRAMSR
jgi:hypothetical protein